MLYPDKFITDAYNTVECRGWRPESCMAVCYVPEVHRRPTDVARLLLALQLGRFQWARRLAESPSFDRNSQATVKLDIRQEPAGARAQGYRGAVQQVDATYTYLRKDDATFTPHTHALLGRRHSS